MKGLLAILGKAKGAEAEKDDDMAEEGDAHEALLSEAKSAASEQDWDGMVDALAGYMRACAGKG